MGLCSLTPLIPLVTVASRFPGNSAYSFASLFAFICSQPWTIRTVADMNCSFDSVDSFSEFCTSCIFVNILTFKLTHLLDKFAQLHLHPRDLGTQAHSLSPLNWSLQEAEKDQNLSAQYVRKGRQGVPLWKQLTGIFAFSSNSSDCFWDLAFWIGSDVHCKLVKCDVLDCLRWY